MWLLIAFIAVPLIEIALFIQVGGWIGLWPTLLVVVLTAIAGTILVRSQGLATLDRLRASLRGEGDPIRPIAHGAFILFSGALLLTPGFFTDAVGFALLVPQVREWLIAEFGRRMKDRVTIVQAEPMRQPDDGPAIDADYVDLDETGPPRRGDSGWTKRN